MSGPVLNPSGEEVAPVIVLAYDGLAADEASVLVDILTAADLTVVIASVLDRPVTSYHGRVVTSKSVADIDRCSALLVPGGLGVRTTSGNPAVVHAIADLAGRATWLGSTSTGSILLAAAGVIDGARVTTHWLAGELITERGLEFVDEPLVEWGRLLTASGIVGSIQLSFRLVGALLGHEAEARVRGTFTPPPTPTDPRYQRAERTWRQRLADALRWNPMGGRRRIVDEDPLLSSIDPDGRTVVFVLDLVDEPDG